MNLKFRNYYIVMMLVTTFALIIAFGAVLYDLYQIYTAFTHRSFQMSSGNLYKVLSSTYIFHVGFVVVILNSIAGFLKSMIGPEFKGAFTPHLSAIMLYLTGMTAMHFSGYLTMEYFFASVIILMIFSIFTFKKWSTELRLINELKEKNPSIFEDDEINKSPTQAEAVKINPQVKKLSKETLTEDLIAEIRKDKKNLLHRPLDFLKIDLMYTLIVYTAQNEQHRKKMKRLSTLGLICRCIFISQLAVVCIFAFKENHSLQFILGNLSAPLFWLMAMLTVQFHYHSAMMIFIAEEKFKKQLFLKKGLIYFALMGTLLCSLGSPDMLISLMSLFYFLSSLWVVRTTEKAFIPELNTITKELLTDTTTAKN